MSVKNNVMLVIVNHAKRIVNKVSTSILFYLVKMKKKML